MRRNQILLATHIGFIFIGIATVLLGPILPFLSSRFSLDDSQSGFLFVLQVTGSLLGITFVGKILDKIGFSRLLFSGFCLMALGILGVGFLSWKGVMFCVFLNGVGLGLTIPAMNLLVAELNPHRSAAALNILNFAWGVGATVSQPFVSFLSNKESISKATVLLTALLFLLGLWFSLFKNFSFSLTKSDEPSTDSAVKVWRTPFAWLSVALFFLYVGTESSIGGWITTYSLRLQNSEANSLWAPATTIFWTALLIGRIAASFFLKIVSDKKLLIISSLLAAIGISLILWTTRFELVLLSAVFVGVGLAPIYPTNMARFTTYFGSIAKQNAGPLFISATLGGASVTWLVGKLSSLSGSLRTGLIVSLFCCVAMIVLQIFLNSFSPTNKQQNN